MSWNPSTRLPNYGPRESWLPQPVPQKRKVFVAYHHGDRFRPGDQYWANVFRGTFSTWYEVLYDRSVQEPVNSNDLEYVNRRIREDFIVGSSVTILLCGANTWKRKCVDWEIHSTLHHHHALLGIALPTATQLPDGSIRTPDRFYANWTLGYTEWMHWTNDPALLKDGIEAAVARSRQVSPDNGMLKLQRNLP